MITCFIALTLTACASTPPPQDELDALVRREGAEAIAGVALVVRIEGETVFEGATGTAEFDTDGITPLRPMTTRSPVRAASVSKLVTALAAHEIALNQWFVLSADLHVWLDFPLDHPLDPDARISPGMLLSHTSGIRDPDVYWMAHPGRIETLLDQPHWADHAPEEGWEYANINYGLLATAMEAAVLERFDVIARTRVLEPLGLGHTGFNWSGVPAEIRRNGATLYVREDSIWVEQVDGRAMLDGDAPTILMADGASLDSYEPGQNGTLFSPQGGWRASAHDMALLAEAFGPEGMGHDLTRPMWRAPGQTWGLGPRLVQPGEAQGWPGGLTGHAGEAYGLVAGAWVTPDGRISIGYVVNGTDEHFVREADAETGFNALEQALLGLAAEIADSR
ncbi:MULTISPECIES: serine hydrolase domain-containing protein [Hyphobacterium]|uniref:Serine hydrolase domain-containing protein n=1 Tax=Hyphobacterium vulgare TaxID=1736751 RepID=A0ABV6ZZF8_9PROT